MGAGCLVPGSYAPLERVARSPLTRCADSPHRPRTTAGNVDAGDVSGSSELTGLFQIKPDGAVEGVQLAGEPVDLQQQRGGHAIGGHAGMTYDYLKRQNRRGCARRPKPN